MEVVYITIAIIILYILMQLIILPKIRYNNLYKTLNTISINNDYELEPCRKKPYSFIIKTSDVNLYISYLNIPSNSSLTINSARTWKLAWGGSKVKPGRSYPKSRYVTEITNFLNCKINDPKSLKVVILYKRTEKVLMYINESEVVFVNPQDTPHGIKVIQFVNLEKDLKDIIK